MPDRFTVTTSPHGMMCISKTDATRDENWFIKRALRANHFDDPYYQSRQKAHPFLQCGSEVDDGYLLVEFWTENKAAVREYVAWLNAQYDAEIGRAYNWGLLE